MLVFSSKEKRLMYAINDDSEELVLFGYQNPLHFLEERGFFRRQQSGAFTLTDLGDAAFKEMLVRGAGADLNEQVIQVRLRRS